jgi:hypothetical protein
MRRLTVAFLAGVVIALGCTQLSAPPPAPAPARVFARLIVHNDMPVSLNVFLSRDGWADTLLRRVLPTRTDTIETTVPLRSAFRLFALSPEDSRYWSESFIIFAVSPFEAEWKVTTPLHMRFHSRSADGR